MLFFFVDPCNCHGTEDDELAEKIDAYLLRYTRQGFSGAVLVAKEGKVVLTKGYGLADRQHGIPVSEKTVFTIGSITKKFTAAAILKLQMMNKLNVQDSITGYFDNVPPDKRDITLHHLLTHTAGFPSAIGDDFDAVEGDRFIALVFDTKLLHPPGTQYEYSNVGYSLLGLIVERVSGMTYERFLNDEIFIPAGMHSTGYKIPEWNQKELAHGYRGEQDWGTLLDRPWAQDGPGWHLRANGGILSTVTDMYLWHLALEGNRILSSEAKKMMFTPHVKEGEGADSYYGYGWAIMDTPWNTRLIAHNGGNSIFAADFHRYVDDDVVLFVASNTAGKTAFKAAEFIARIVFDQPYSLPLDDPLDLDERRLGQTEMGRRSLELVRTLGDTDESVRTFVQAHFTSEKIQASGERLTRFMSQRDGELGRVTFYSALQTGERTIELTVQSVESQKWWRLTLEFAEPSPHLILTIFVDHTRSPHGVSVTDPQGDDRWELPPSLTGHRSSSLLDILHGGKAAHLGEFIETMLSDDCVLEPQGDDPVAFFERWHEAMAPVDLLGAMKTGSHSARLRVESMQSRKRFLISFELETEPPNRFRSLAIEIGE